ncbi:MAG: hypothetical protein IKF17_04535 [Clostridia bacterium]|nr:hypothetical protein [Clostridia bacterium]
MATSKHGKNTHSRGRKRNEKFNSAKKIIIFIVLILTIVIAVDVLINMRKDKLFGSWTTDGITIYKFNGKGQGYLVTTLSRYEFNYKIKKNELYIDFLSDKAKDANYEFSIDEDKLVVDGIDETTGSYTMTRK